MKNQIFLLTLVIALAASQSCDNTQTGNIMAGQTIMSGTANIYNTDGYFHVDIFAEGDWYVQAAHVYIGAEPPTDLAPGRFTYEDEFEMTKNYRLHFPIDFDCTSKIYVAVHTEMVRTVDSTTQNETGWLEGRSFDNARWGFYSEYQLECECGDPGVVTEPVDPKIYQCCDCVGGCEPHVTPIYAGQDMNSGYAMIENNAETLIITLESTDPWLMSEIHIYIGSVEPDTYSPGQFGWQVSFPSGIGYYKLTVRIVNGELVLEDGSKPEYWNQNFVNTDNLKIAIHTTNIRPTEVEGGDETGWAYGDWDIDPNGKRWGWGVTYQWCSGGVVESPNMGCTFTQGYWKNHNKYASQPKRRIDWPISEDTLLCDYTYYQALKSSVRGDVWLILAHQYIAAILNVANGADDSSVAQELSDAQKLLESKCGRVPDKFRQQFTDLASTLDQFNNGLIGPGHCDSEIHSDSYCECRCVVGGDTLPEFNINQNETLITDVDILDDSDVELIVTKGKAKFKDTKKRYKSYVIESETEFSSGYLSIRPIPTTNPSSTDPTTTNPTSVDPTTTNPTSVDPTTTNPTSVDPTTTNPTTTNPTSTDPTSTDPVVTERPTGTDPSNPNLTDAPTSHHLERPVGNKKMRSRSTIMAGVVGGVVGGLVIIMAIIALIVINSKHHKQFISNESQMSEL